MQTRNLNPAQYEPDTFPFGDGARILDIRYDPVFKAVFTKDTAKSRGALSDLISSLIGRAVTVEAIIANEPAADDIRQRQLRFDVACKTGKGEPINVEMSFNPKAHEPVRLEYHTARLFLRQDIHGKDKTYNDLKETYQIAILANKKFFLDENFAHNFQYYDPDNRVSLGGRTRIITVELAKTEPVVGKPVEEMTNAELWAVFFEYLTDEEKRGKIIEIINREEGIAMAVETLVNITQDEVEYERMSNLIKSQLDWNTDLFEARNEGLEEGLTKGRSEGLEEGLAKGRSKGLEEGLTRGHNEGLAKGRIETASNLKALGVSADIIIKSTGLSPEEIAKL
jgi:predicted transposase/invertase (TIGR01784 family)